MSFLHSLWWQSPRRTVVYPLMLLIHLHIMTCSHWKGHILCMFWQILSHEQPLEQSRKEQFLPSVSLVPLFNEFDLLSLNISPSFFKDCALCPHTGEHWKGPINQAPNDWILLLWLLNLLGFLHKDGLSFSATWWADRDAACEGKMFDAFYLHFQK